MGHENCTFPLLSPVAVRAGIVINRRSNMAVQTAPKKAASPGTTGRQALIDALNEDLAGEFQAIVMYIQYSAKLTGPYRNELRGFFQAEIADEQRHAQFLADKIATLGGEPTTQARPVPDADTPHEMLERIREAEARAIADYSERVQQAEAFGDIGLKVELENQVADETKHKEEVERILSGWSGG
jgi:bacterioferritin